MPPAPRPAPSPLAWLLLFLLGLTWGGSFLGIAKALTGFGPLTIAAARITIAAATMISLNIAPVRCFPCGQAYIHTLHAARIADPCPTRREVGRRTLPPPGVPIAPSTPETAA